MAVKGKLIIVGGAEDKGNSEDKGRMDADPSIDGYFENGVLHRIVEESAQKKRSRIEILTTASTVPEEIGNDYKEAFGKLGAKNTGILNIDTRELAEDEQILKRLKAAHVIMSTGGDQMRLTSVLGGTPFLNLMHEKFKKDNFVYAGSSAGAAAASNSMVFQGPGDLALFKGKVRVTSGLGLINDMIIDTHFITRGRIGRLLQIVVSNPRILGVGLEENAALLITGQRKMEAIGPGMSIIIDGRMIKDTNFNDIEDGQSVSIENAVLHVMSKYDIYDLKEFKLSIDHRNNRDE